MITITLCMIVKNEEQTLARCLESVRPAVDEIVIADTGSSDRTLEIARQFTPRVWEIAWENDFAKARNFTYACASTDYQLWLDADDVLPPTELEKLLHLKETLPPQTDMVTMPYHTHFDADGLPLLTMRRERLTRRENGYRWMDPVHECIPLQGRVYHSDVMVLRQKPPQSTPNTRNLEIYEARVRRGVRLTPRQSYYYARELHEHGQHAQAAERFLQYINGGQGWPEDNIAACFYLAACYTALGARERALEILLRSFSFGPPRAEICCELGYYYRDRRDLPRAVEWFTFAAALTPPPYAGFVYRDYWGCIPNLELCVLHYALGDKEKAAACNERAAQYKPQSQAVAFNRAFFAGG